MATTFVLTGASRTSSRSTFVLKVSEAALVAGFALILLGSLWVTAGMLTRAVENATVLRWLFPTGVGLFMALAATALWTWMLPNMVEFVRNEFQRMTRLVAIAAAKGGR